MEPSEEYFQKEKASEGKRLKSSDLVLIFVFTVGYCCCVEHKYRCTDKTKVRCHELLEGRRPCATTQVESWNAARQPEVNPMPPPGHLPSQPQEQQLS